MEGGGDVPDDIRRKVSQYRLEQFDRALRDRSAEGAPAGADDGSPAPVTEPADSPAPTAADRAAYVETAI